MHTNRQSSQRSRLSRPLATAISAALSLAAASAAHGGPQGGVVTSGDAAISTPDLNLTQIDQGSHSASIDWQSFDVAAQERVIFNQPSASAVALNRILAQDPSQVHGSISANGRVFLINPNGIIFGATSRINVGSLVASSLDITDVDAATGRYTFSTAAQHSGAISNSGQITAASGGSVTLLGGSVVNDGLIVADYGSVNLGAGRAATLHFDGDGLVRFQVDAGLLSNASGAGAAVDNTGEILADGGQVLLTARAASDVVARAVNNDGVIRAARVENVGGRIRLVGPEGTVVNNGTLDATGVGASGTGGEVQVLGDRVELTGTSLVDVSGSAGGGTALIGGSFGGGDPAVLNARQTDVQSGAVIVADSTGSEAGQVAVWADGTTTFDGDIFARATGPDGNGGYAEVSGREHLRVGGHASLGSANGVAGTLLLDPGSVTIVNGNAGPTAAMDTVSEGWINTQLGLGSLEVTTVDSTNGAVVQSLTVNGNVDISWNNANTLTLTGTDSVSLLAGSTIENTGTGALAGALILGSSGDVVIGGTISMTAGNLTVDAGGAIAQSAALAIGGDLSFTAGGPITQSASLSVGDAASFTTLNDTGAAITLNGSSNNFGSVRAAVRNTANTADAAASIVIHENSGTLLGDVRTAAGQSVSVVSAGAITAIANTGVTTGTVDFSSDGSIELADVQASNSLSLNSSGGGITQTGAWDVTGTSSFTAGTGENVLLNLGNAFTGAVSIAAQDATLHNSTATTLGTFGIAGDLSVTAGGAITQSGSLSVGDAASFTTLNGTGAAITLNGPNNNFGSVQAAVRNAADTADAAASIVIHENSDTLLGDVRTALGQSVSVVSAGAITALANTSVTSGVVGLVSNGNLQVSGVRAGNSISLTSNNGGITQSGALDIDGASTFTAAGGQSIVLGNAANSFDGAVSFAAVTGQLQDLTVSDTTALDLQSPGISGNLTVTAGGALNLQALSVGGSVTATADSITQSGALNVGTTSSFTAAAGQSIVLNNAGNSFGGTVGFAGSGGNLQDVTLRDLTALDLLAMNLDGNLTVAAGGAITQSGSLNAAGAASFRTLNDAGAAITLDGANSFGSVQAAVRNTADAVDAPASIVIHENNDTVLGDVRTGVGQSVSVVSAGAIAALANTSITTSSVSLMASGDIGSIATPILLSTSAGHVSADTNGSVYLTNVSGIASTVALDHVVAGSAGTIDFQGDGDIRVADVRAGDSVSLTSTNGSIVDDNVNGAGSQIVTDSLTLLAAGAIGQAPGVGNGALDLQAGSVSATAQGGGVFLDETDGDLNIRQVSAAGPVWIQAAAGSILDDAADAIAASITSTTGGVQLSALDNIGTVTDMRTRQGSPLAINTNGGALSAHVGSATGQVNLDLASGSNPTAAAAAITAGGSGRLLIQSAGDLSLNSFNAAITGFSDVGFSADGTLQVSGRQSDLIAGPLNTLFLRGGNDIAQADRLFELSANHLVFESGAQGGNVTLNTNVDQLDAEIGNGASLTVVDGGDITLGSVTASGDVSISAANIFDDGDLNGVTRITAGNALSLQGSAGIGREDGTSGGRIDTAGNSVSVLAAAGPVFLSHLGDLQVSGEAQGGLIDIVAPTGSITLNGMLRASESLTLAAGGAITDADDAATYLSAGDVNLAAALIGSQGNRLNIDATLLNANAAGGIYVNEANAVQLRNLTAQEVVINAAGNITDDGDAQTRIVAGNVVLSGSAIGAAGAGNEIDTSIDSLTATAAAGGIYVGELDNIELAAVSAGGVGNDVTIVAAGAITDDGDNATRVAGGNLTLTATTLGAAGTNGELDTQATSLTASASSGGIYVGEVDDLQLNSITAGAGSDVVLSAGGVLTDDGNDATRVTGENVTLAASRIGVVGNRVDTAAATLSATATNGGIYLDEQDTVTLADVRSAGTGNEVDLRTGNNGSITVQNLMTQGGAVNLAAGGTGSLTVTGEIASNNGVVNLTAGNALAVPDLSTGTGTVVLHTVNDLNVGTITAGSISITSDTGNISLGTVNAGTGTASITADNGTISDGTATSLTAGQATLSARSIGSEDNPLNVAVGTLTATTSAGGVFVEETDGLTVAGINSAGRINLVTGGALIQGGAMTSAGNAIALSAGSIDMLAAATTDSAGGDITYVANSGDATLSVLNAGTGRVLTIAADNVFSVLDPTAAVNNVTASAVEIRAGGLGAGLGEIGTANNPLAISTPAGANRSVFLVVPLVNGIQTSTPRINYSGPSSSLLLKGYSGDSGALLFDQSSAFTADTVLGNGESIVPLLNGRIAINSDSLRAARQALSSGVVNTVSVDWAAFDPDVSLFGTLDPPLRLPADQIDEAGL